MRVIVAGSRVLCSPQTTFDAIEEAVASGMEIDEVVSGRAPGPDTYGEEWAGAHGIPVTPMPADWIKWGTKLAGRLRNTDMAVYAKTGPKGGGLILVHTGKTPGSLDMLKKAKKFNLKIFEKIVG